MRFNASLIKTWMGCPLQARFQSIERLPYRVNAKASFGTVVHKCLEEYNHTGNLEQCIELFKDYWSNPEKLGVTPEVWPKLTTYGGLRQRGIEILQEYHEKLKWESREVIATEHHFLVPFGEHEISGYVDLVELKKGVRGKPNLRIVDYKTNSKAPTLNELRLNIQYTTYIYASMQPEFWVGNGPNFPAIPNGEERFSEFETVNRQGIWYHLWSNKELKAGERDDADFMRLYRVCVEIAKAVEHNVFVPNISGETCTFCDYVEPCGLPINPRTYKGDEDDG